FEFTANLAVPRPVFEGLSRPRRLLYRRDVFPRLVAAWTVAMMQCIEDPKLRLPRGIQDLQHIWRTTICFGHTSQAIPYFASLGNEIVVRVNDKKCSDFLVKLQICHFFSYSPACNAASARWRHPQALRPLWPTR